MDNLSKDLNQLEDNLISVVNDLKASTEIILKELTGYLNVSAHDLSEIHSTMIKVETVLYSLKDSVMKLDTLEKELLTIKPSIITTETKIINNINDRFNNNSNNLKKIAGFISTLSTKNTKDNIEINEKINNVNIKLDKLDESFKNMKNELIGSQEGLYKIINTLTSNQSDVKKAQISLEGSKIKTDAEKYKNKMWFWTKIVGIFFSSGGIIFLIVKSIIESFTK